MAAGPHSHAGGWARRLGWLAVYWLAGVAALGAVALLLRTLMRLAGLVS